MICPSCGSERVHRSRRKWFEKPMRLIGIRPFRCHDCQHRFFTTPLGARHPAMLDSRKKQQQQ